MAIRIYRLVWLSDASCGFSISRADFEWCLRIPDGVCGFLASCADSQPVVRIPNRLCGFPIGCADFRRVVRIVRSPKAPGNGLLRLQVTDSKPIWQKIPITNPHRSSKIRTTEPESTQSAKNPHGSSKIRTTHRESARFVFLRHKSHVTSLCIA